MGGPSPLLESGVQDIPLRPIYLDHPLEAKQGNTVKSRFLAMPKGVHSNWTTPLVQAPVQNGGSRDRTGGPGTKPSFSCSANTKSNHYLDYTPRYREVS
jgi:hypothetical protein